MSDTLGVTRRKTVGVRDIPLVLLSPGRVFARVEDVPAWGWPLVILLTAVTLVGYATVQTGLIDREIDRRVAAAIARIDEQQRDVVERSELRELYALERKTGEFMKMLTRIRVIVAEPAKALASALLIAAAFYGIVALTGRKPEWHTLLTVCVFAGFVDVLRLLTALLLMLQYQTLDIDTSLALLARLMPDAGSMEPAALAATSGLLTALDPFRVWFWLVLLTGLSATSQLRGWRAWTVCGLCWLAGAGARCGLAVAAAQSAARGTMG